MCPSRAERSAQHSVRGLGRRLRSALAELRGWASYAGKMRSSVLRLAQALDISLDRVFCDITVQILIT